VAEIEFRKNWQMREAGLVQGAQDRPLLLLAISLVRLPVLAELDFGHTDPITTLPYGAVAQIDCSLARLTILETGVADIRA
jgi:hypothetical protein